MSKVCDNHTRKSSFRKTRSNWSTTCTCTNDYAVIVCMTSIWAVGKRNPLRLERESGESGDSYQERLHWESILKKSGVFHSVYVSAASGKKI
jgi:hypothetical protein